LSQSEVEWQRSLGGLVLGILEHFVAEVVESTITDMGIQLDLPEHKLRVLDSTPGGNGLSEALLSEGRLSLAFENCKRALSKFKSKGAAKQFDKYVLALCHEKPSHPSEEVMNVVRELHVRWSG
jgi:hypothetical protein